MAIVLVGASPFIASGLQRRSLLGPPGSAVGLERWLVTPVAALSLAAGLIHIAVMGDHFAEDTLSGLFFVIVAVTQVSWTAAFVSRPQPRLAAMGLAVNAAVVLTWVVTRTVGLPFGAHPFMAEPVGLSDLFATAAEVLVVAGTAATCVPRWRMAAARRRVAVSSADLAVVMALVAIALATSFALTDVALNGGHPAA